VKGKRSWATPLLLVLIVLLALGLRLYRLDSQSLWADEGNSVALASRSLAAITHDAAQDIHPPLYYYLLHLWVRVFGDSEIALRSLSALMGTGLVFVTYLLGQQLFNRRLALIASFLAAISPLQIHYSQETRMYVPAALWGALAIYFFVRWVRLWKAPGDGSGGRRPVALFASLYVLFTVAALYTHYFAFTIPIVANVAYALGTIPYRSWRRPRAIGGWVAAQLIIVALYYPWLMLAGRQLTTWPAISEPFTLGFFLQELIRVFSLGLAVEPRTTPVVLVFAVLLLLGVVPTQLRPTPQEGEKLLLPRTRLHALILAALYLCLPVLAMYLISLSRPAYDPKLLLLATPAFHLLLARAIGGEWLGAFALAWRRAVSALRPRAWLISRWAVTGIGLLFVVGASAPALANYYFDQRYARDDYRGLARYISAVGQEGDAVILNAPGQMDIFSYYYGGPLPVYPLPGQRPLDENKTTEALEGIVARHKRLFVLFWGTDESDPHRFIEGWLDRRTFKALDSWRGNVRLAVYAVPEEEISREIQHPMDVRLGDQVRFLGYSMAGSEVRAGDILQLTLFWEALGPMETRYKVFTHVLDGRSHIVGQRDAEPVGGARPTTTWQTGEVIADNYGVLIMLATPPGEHQLEIGMYDAQTGERLPVVEEGQVLGDRLVLEPVRVVKAQVPPLIEALGIQHQQQVDYGPVDLLGYDLTKLGYEHQPDEPLHPGDILHLTLYWQTVAQIDGDFTLTLQLLDEAGTTVVSQDVRPVGGAYPPTAWEPGEIVRDQHNLLLPATASPGKFGFYLQIHGLPEGEGPLMLRSLTVRG
jgi:mannosyltransferase